LWLISTFIRLFSRVPELFRFRHGGDDVVRAGGHASRQSTTSSFDFSVFVTNGDAHNPVFATGSDLVRIVVVVKADAKFFGERAFRHVGSIDHFEVIQPQNLEMLDQYDSVWFINPVPLFFVVRRIAGGEDYYLVSESDVIVQDLADVFDVVVDAGNRVIEVETNLHA
jgi:hypothetical protein